MSGDNLNNSENSEMVEIKNTTSIVQTETTTESETNGVHIKQIEETATKETISSTEEQQSSEAIKEDPTSKRKIDEIENISENKDDSNPTTPLKKQKDEKIDDSPLKSDTKNEAATVVTPTRFGFGSTLSDPKYAWLSNVGKPAGPKATESTFKTEKPSGLFGSISASSAPSLGEITPTKSNGFGDLLQSAPKNAVEDKKPSPTIALQDVSNGEENEATSFETKGKLHVMGQEKKWIERGVGLLKINYKRDNISDRRLIMRLEAVHKVILNVKVPSKLKPVAEGKFVRFSAFENETAPSFFLFRTTSDSIALQMVEEMIAASE